MNFSVDLGVFVVVVFGILAVVSAIALLVCVFLVRVGNAELEVRTDSRSPFALDALTERSAAFSTKIEFANVGKQCGTVMDCYVRHLLPYEQFDGVAVSSKAELESAPREDDYFEATIIQRGESAYVLVKVTLEARGDGDIKEALTRMVDMPIDVVYQFVGRDPWRIDKRRIELKAAEVAALVGVTLADR